MEPETFFRLLRTGFFRRFALISMLTVLSTGAFATTHYKVAIIMFNFKDYSTTTVTPAAIQNATFMRTGTDLQSGSVNSYFNEVTEGEIQFTGHLNANGDVFGWYTLDRSRYHPDDGRTYACPPLEEDAVQVQPLLPEVRAAAAADGFNLANYDFVIYASNVADCNASWKGQKSIMAAAIHPDNWAIYAHELGHGLGLQHANLISCSDAGNSVPWGGECEVREYGDGYSVMGWHDGVGHFSVVDKLRLGVWAMDEQVAEVRHSSGFWLRSVTEPSSRGGLRGLRIRTRTNPNWTTGGTVFGPNHAADIFYYLEYRTRNGFNVTTQDIPPEDRGVYVRTGVALEHGQMPLLLDMNQQTESFALEEGEWYQDTTSRVSFRVVPGTQSERSVKVEVVVSPAIDYDHDGLGDIAFHRPNSSWATVPITFAEGDGTWDWTNLSAPRWAHGRGVVAVTGHFNGDGFTDVAFYCPGSGWRFMPILMADGSGGWTAYTPSVPSWANQPGVIAVTGHFNNDGFTDIAFYRPGGPWNTTPVLFSNGDGTWTSENYATPSWANQPGVIAIPGYFNDDGRTDIAFHRPGGPWNTTPVLFSNGDGTWTSKNYTTPNWANQPGVRAVPGQYNGDRFTDIAFYRPGGPWSSLPVLFASGNGSWTSRNYPASVLPHQTGVQAIAGHFDDDALTDIAFQRPGSYRSELPVFFSSGDGNWNWTVEWAPNWANQPGSIAVPGQYDEDFFTDIAFYRPGVWSITPILFGLGNGTWHDTDNGTPSWANASRVVAIDSNP